LESFKLSSSLTLTPYTVTLKRYLLLQPYHYTFSTTITSLLCLILAVVSSLTAIPVALVHDLYNPLLKPS